MLQLPLLLLSSSKGNGEPTNEGVGEVLNGNEGGEEDNMTEMSAVDGGKNLGVSGPGLRLLNHVSPERRVVLFGFQGRVASSILIGTFASVVKLSTGEEALAIFSEYAHDPGNHVTIHSTLQLTSHGMIVEDRSPRFGTPPSITTLEGDVIPLLFTDGLPTLGLRYPTDTEVVNMRRIYLTGSNAWDPSVYDRPTTIPSICITPSSTVYEPAELPPHDDESDDTSVTQDCDSIDDTVDTDNINNSLEMTGQVSIKYKEVIRELEELWAYKEVVRHRLKTVLRELREVSMQGDIEGRLIAATFGDKYSHGVYKTLPPQHAPQRGEYRTLPPRQAPSKDDTAYIGSWTTFLLRNESLITQARSDEIAHRLTAHQLLTGRAGNPKTKLNQCAHQAACIPTQHGKTLHHDHQVTLARLHPGQRAHQ